MTSPHVIHKFSRALAVLAVVLPLGIPYSSFAATDQRTVLVSKVVSVAEAAAKSTNDVVKSVIDSPVPQPSPPSPVVSPNPTTQAVPASSQPIAPTATPSPQVPTQSTVAPSTQTQTASSAPSSPQSSVTQPGNSRTATATAGTDQVGPAAKVVLPVIDTIHNYTARTSDHYAKLDTIGAPLFALILKGSAAIAGLGLLLVLFPGRSPRRMRYKVPVSDVA
jgi:hypothetical protein